MNKEYENNIGRAFQTLNHKAFIPFLTAGDPTPGCTVEYILEMERAGADLIEIGIPFSDPTAESVEIQDANIRALEGGMNTDGVFDIVHRVRVLAQESGKAPVPLAFMTYANPVLHYGCEPFFARCEELGVGAVIVPDLPYEEKQELEGAADAHHVALISMIASTSRERIQMIAREAKGFIYVVSSTGVTGVRGGIDTSLESVVKSIREVTDVPCVVGFGINTPDQARQMARISDGVIVGSAIVKLIARDGEQAAPAIYEYVKSMKAAVASV